MKATLAALVLTGCAGAASLTRVTELPVPAAPRSAEPSVVRGADGRLYLSWIEGERALKFSVLEGTAWSEPKSIAEGDGWFVNWADFPSMAALADGSLAAHWLEKLGSGTYAYGVRVTCSRDGGSTWSAPFWLHRDASPTEHGFVSFVAQGDRFGAVWLDGRQMTAEGGEMTLRAVTFDPDGRLGEEQIIDARVCECCSTSAAADGPWLVVYRDRSEDEIRDVGVARFSADGWTASTVHDDRWNIRGCPVNGPRIAARGDRAIVAWYSEPHNDARVAAAWSSDGGRTFGPPRVVDAAGPVGRVDVAMLDDGSAAVSWLGRTGLRAEVRVVRVDPDGTLGAVLALDDVPNSRVSGVPRMARLGRGLVVTWTHPGRGVRTARVD